MKSEQEICHVAEKGTNGLQVQTEGGGPAATKNRSSIRTCQERIRKRQESRDKTLDRLARGIILQIKLVGRTV